MSKLPYCKVEFDRHCLWVGVHVWPPLAGKIRDDIWIRHEITFGVLGILLRIYWFNATPPSDS